MSRLGRLCGARSFRRAGFPTPASEESAAPADARPRKGTPGPKSAPPPEGEGAVSKYGPYPFVLEKILKNAQPNWATAGERPINGDSRHGRASSRSIVDGPATTSDGGVESAQQHTRTRQPCCQQ